MRFRIVWLVRWNYHYPVAAEIADVCIIEGHRRILARLVAFAGLRTSSLLAVVLPRRPLSHHDDSQSRRLTRVDIRLRGSCSSMGSYSVHVPDP
jgi:hypothetical protein